MGWPVFVSYAQSDRDSLGHLEKFKDALEEQLFSELEEPKSKPVLFFDRDSVEAGAKWSPAIVDAVRTANSLVCLISPTYLGREWCGRELEVFLRRLEKPGPHAAGRFIFPIWWQVPAVPRPLPARLGQFKFDDAGFPRDYQTLGVKGLARGAKRVQFIAAVDSLARALAKTLHKSSPQLAVGDSISDILAITNAFDEQQPFDVRLLTLTPGGAAWRPSDSDLPVADAVASAARRLQVYVRPAETGSGMRAGLVKAQAERQVLLAIADASTAPDATLHEVNGTDLANLAILLVDTAVPSAGADAWFARFPEGSFAKARAAGLTRTAGISAVAPELERLMDDARRRLQSSEPVAAAKSAELTARAQAEQGISVATQPNLSGPGSGL